MEGEKLTASLLRLRHLGGSSGGDWGCWLHFWLFWLILGFGLDVRCGGEV